MADGTLAGSVKDIRNMQPIENADVAIQGEGDSSKYDAKSGADGNWSQGVPAGTYDLTVSASGYDDGIYPGIVVIDDVTTDLPFVLYPSES